MSRWTLIRCRRSITDQEGAARCTNRLVSHFLFATTPRDPLTVSTVILGVFGTAMLAAYIPARRVLRVDPTTALRAE